MNISKTIARSLRRIAEAFDPTGTDAEGATYEVTEVSGYSILTPGAHPERTGDLLTGQAYAEAKLDLLYTLERCNFLETATDYEPVPAGRDFAKASVFVARRKNLPGNSKNKPEK